MSDLFLLRKTTSTAQDGHDRRSPMKRRTRLIFIGCATVGGTFFSTAAAQAAFAAPSTNQTVEQITVQPGDTLSAIGARTSRSWETLAAYNELANPNLIFVGQVIDIPASSYVPTSSTSSGSSSTSSESPSSHSSYTPPAPPTPPPSSGTTTVAAVASHPSTAPSSSSGSAPSGIWGCIAAHESGGNPSTNTGNGYYGMYQDTQSSWVSGGGLAYAPRADLASAAAQTAVNQNIQAQQGWGAWPVSSAACGA